MVFDHLRNHVLLLHLILLFVLYVLFQIAREKHGEDIKAQLQTMYNN